MMLNIKKNKNKKNIPENLKKKKGIYGSLKVSINIKSMICN